MSLAQNLWSMSLVLKAFFNRQDYFEGVIENLEAPDLKNIFSSLQPKHDRPYGWYCNVCNVYQSPAPPSRPNSKCLALSLEFKKKNVHVRTKFAQA